MRASPIATCLALSAAAFAQPADLVLRNGKIVTMNAARAGGPGDRGARRHDRRPRQRCATPRNGSARAPKSSTCTACSPSPASSKATATSPASASSRMGLDLREARTWDDIVAQVARAVEAGQAGRVDRRPRLAPGEVDQRARRRTSKASRCTTSLDKVSPNNPVVLTHASGHAAFVNAQGDGSSPASRATTPNPAGGEILKDANGNADRPAARARAGLVGRARGGVRRQAHAGRDAAPNCAKRSTWPSTRASPRASRRSRTPARRSPPIDVLKKMADKARAAHAPLDDAARRRTTSSPPKLDRYRIDRRGRQPLHRARHQARRSMARSARAAPGCSSRTPTSPTAAA